MVSDASLLQTEQSAGLAAAAVEYIPLYTLKTPHLLAAAGIGSTRQYQHNLFAELGLRRINPNTSAGVVDRYPGRYTGEFEFISAVLLPKPIIFPKVSCVFR